MAMDMEEWNELYPPGTPVIWTPDGGVPIETKTTGKATQPARLAMVRVEGYPQPVCLHRVEPVVEGPPEQWEVRVARLCAELETAIGTQAPRMTVECVAHTLATHPTLEVSNATMDRVILLMIVTFSQGQEIERQRLGVVLDEQAVKLQ